MLYGYRHTLKNRVMFAVHGQQVRTILLYGIHKQTSAGDQRLFIRQQHRFAGTDGCQRWHQPRSTHNRRHDLVKLEVLGDPSNLFPNMPETLKAAETLVKEGFEVMVYCADDPIQARMLEDIGCVAVMPLASLIGSGMGILNPWNLRLIIDNAKVPVLVDAGVGTASDAAIAMELGCDGVLMNTAIAAAGQPVLMASAMKKAVEAGREAFLAGRMPRKFYSADPSSPTQGLIGS